MTYNIIVTFASSNKDKEISSIMKTSELLEILRSNGCFLEKHGSRHNKWKNRVTGEFEWVPRHAAEVHKGLAQKILKKLVGE